MKITITRLWLPFLLAVAAGCATTPADPASDPNLYYVNYGDVLNVEIYKEPDISRAFEVGSDGTINHPFLGRVEVVGLSVAEVESRLTNLLEADYLVDPRVSVSVARSSDRPIMIFGEVRSPGAYEVQAGQRFTMLQLIARAGGFTDIAARDRVRIVRLVNGKEQTIKVRVTDLLRGRDGVTDIDLRAGDVITVPETLF